MIHEILHFLIPELEFLQLAFFSVMSLLLVVVVLGVKRAANERHWENNWLRRTDAAQTDVLAAEYGSSHELSDIVATRSEKLADIMPGILLILGLLGTFLGLGIALDKASQILTQSGLSSGSMDGTMSNLMGMMQGLGTKFKTSTWGIMAFLTLKAWATMNGYEDRRLRWCVATLKKHAAEVTRLQAQEKAHAESRLVSALGSVGETIVAGLARMDENRRAESTEHAGLLQHLNEAMRANVAEIEAARARIDVQTEQLGTMIGEASERTARDMKQSDERRETGFAQQAQALAGLSELAGRSVTTLERMHETHRGTAAKHAELLQSLNEVSRTTVAAIEATYDKLDAQTQQVSTATRHADQTRAAIESFVQANMENIERLSDAGETMSTAAAEMSRGADKLQGVIDNLQGQIVDVLGKVSNGLDASIASMNESFRGNLNQMSMQLATATNGIRDSVDSLSGSVDETLDKMGTQLETATGRIRESVDLLSTNVDKTLVKMGDQLEAATDGITLSVTGMSNAVNEALGEMRSTVNGAIDNSAKLQSKASATLGTLIDELNGSVGQSSEMIKTLAEPIRLGLSSVSESNMRIGEMFKEISRLNTTPQRKKRVTPEKTAGRPSKVAPERKSRVSLV